MPKRLLLVDDEEFFLKSLKDGLDPLSEVFYTDICHSVNEAIKCIVTRKYDMVITDIRMPKKSGLELLVYLREMRFQGKVMVMSAYNTAESNKKIKAMGAVSVISKPFNLEWFKKMLLEQFRNMNRTESVTFETIDLVTVMQIINMEKKNAALQVDIDGKKGAIYFIDGEVVHAHFDGKEGEPAVMELISLNTGVLSVKKVQGKVKRTMKVPFTYYMMHIMKTIDEIRGGRRQPICKTSTAASAAQDEAGTTEGQGTQDAASGGSASSEPARPSVPEILAPLSDVKGYLGAAVFSPQGEFLEGTKTISNIQFEQAGSWIHDVFNDASKISKQVGFGQLDMLQLYTEKGVIFTACFNQGDTHFHTILVIRTEGNIAMAKMTLKKVVKALSEIL